MKRKNHTPEEIITKLRKLEALTAQGATVAEAVKQIAVSEQTYYRWKKQYGSMDREELKRLKALEKENARLKKLVADLTLDKDILKEALSGKGDLLRSPSEPVASPRRRAPRAVGTRHQRAAGL